jgi:hypothetical protein
MVFQSDQGMMNDRAFEMKKMAAGSFKVGTVSNARIPLDISLESFSVRARLVALDFHELIPRTQRASYYWSYKRWVRD